MNEAFVTNPTDEECARFFVNFLDMLAQTWGVIKVSLTNPTDKWAFVMSFFQVTDQIGIITKGPLASLAGEWVSFLNVVV